jgi:16S rRNA (uracil1498-N3)-methyltransferase
VRRRFFVQQFGGDRAILEGEGAHHLVRVLRAKAGQLYELSDGKRARLGRIDKVGRDRVEFALLEELPAHPEGLQVTLLLAVVKFDMFEWAIEKATELGVAVIVPLSAARSDKALLSAAAKRADRWNKILLEASQQSRRIRVPVLSELATPESAFVLHQEGLRVMLSELPGAPAIHQVLKGQRQSAAALAIGPEGGWSEAEFEAAGRSGFQEASLGKLILRTETAVVAALASLNYALNEK